MNVLDRYAADVVNGVIPAGTYHRLACSRHQRDRKREGTPEFPYRFEIAKAERFFRFAQQLKHYKGEWAGQPIILQPHQHFRLGSLFGWAHIETGRRRFRTAYNELPRKQGKSLEAAIVMLYGTFYDGEPGAEGYCIATKRDQAKLVFNDARKLVRSSGLKSKVEVYTANLHRDDTASKLEPLGADVDSTDGLNPQMVCVDEFHAHKDRGLIDVMETATGARRQPIFFQITTAGDDPLSPCGDQHDYACKILDQALEDETFFAFIAHADPDDDWLDERTWQKANPNWGVSIYPDDLRALATKAKHMPSASATFKQKRLNLWVNTFAPCLSVEGWRKGQSQKAPEAFEAALEHEPCYVGVDLLSKLDLMALSFVFPPAPGRSETHVIQRIWTPEDTVDERAHRDRAPYRQWVDQGWIRTTPGKRLDRSVIRAAILQARDRYDIECIGVDPNHDDQLLEQLVKEDGFAESQVIDVPQTVPRMSSACLKMQADILESAVNANGCPVTAWAVSNAVSRDTEGNLMFTKDPKKMRGRIEPLVSATIGVGLWLKQPPQPQWTGEIRVLGQ